MKLNVTAQRFIDCKQSLEERRWQARVTEELWRLPVGRYVTFCATVDAEVTFSHHFGSEEHRQSDEDVARSSATFSFERLLIGF